jgi:hypothetical protein
MLQRGIRFRDFFPKFCRLVCQIHYMQKKLYLIALALVFIPCFSFAQSSGDTARKNTFNIHDVTFTKAEVMPQFQNGWAALADRLKQELHQHYSHFGRAIISVQMIVQKSGEITDIRLVQASPDDSRMIDPLITALKKTSGSWVPAWQNGRSVRCYKMITVTFEKKDLLVTDHR